MGNPFLKEFVDFEFFFKKLRATKDGNNGTRERGKEERQNERTTEKGNDYNDNTLTPFKKKTG